jgi:uncharacterized damage-inducible protein DinB
MKKNLFGPAIALAFVFGLAPLAARAQQNPVTNAMRQMVKQHANWLVAGAEEYPANKLNFRPTPQQWTFGHLMWHIANANDFFCSRISGDKAPALGHITPHSSKAVLLAAMKKSFNFCEQSLANVKDSELDQKVSFFGGHQITKGAAVIAMANDMADHYAQESMYLRLNGHLPPTAMPHRHMGK